MPGALIALGVAYLAALGTSRERPPRPRPAASPRAHARATCSLVAGVESVVIGLVAGVLGSALGLAAVSAPGQRWRSAHASGAGPPPLLAGDRARRSPGSAAARLGEHPRGALAEVTEGRRAVAHVSGAPPGAATTSTSLALALSGLIYWLTIRTGFSAVVNPDSNPTLSLSVYMFFGPALLWIGATLLLRPPARPVHGRLWRSRAARQAGQPRLPASSRASAAGRRRSTAASSSSACCSPSRSTSASSRPPTTSRRRSTPSSRWAPTSPSPPRRASPPRSDLPAKVAAVPGVSCDHGPSTTPTPTSGPDLQDTFGIDAAHFRKRDDLRDSYFLGGSADQMMSRLASTPDGILVSHGDDHRLLAAARRPAPAAGARPEHRPVPRRAVPRRRHRPGVPLGPEGLVHGREPRLPRPAHPLGPQRRLREDERQPAGCRLPRRRGDRRRSARRSRTSTSRPRRRSPRSPPST